MTAVPHDPDPIILALDPAAAAKADRLAAFDAEEVRLGKEVARKAKIARDNDFFLHTPHWMIPTGEQQKAQRKEAEARSFDADQCLLEHCAIWQLCAPRSILGQEAKRLHQEKLAAKAEADAEAARVAEETQRAHEKREKRRLSQKAYRQRKSAARQLAAATEA